MPVVYSTYPDGRPIFEVTPAGTRRSPTGTWSLDVPALWSFGAMRVPVDIWRCLSRFDAWIEPSLIAEWVRWMHVYARSQGRTLSESAIAGAMRWSDPERDVSHARRRALALLADRPLHCVWTGRRLTDATLDIDHCFPWAIWPCDSLWNLLPSSRRVNQHEKRDRVPSDDLLAVARERIESWWHDAWHAPGDALTPRRFADEARADLPGLPGSTEPIALADVSGGMRIQQARLRFNQQVAQWDP